MGTAFCQHRTPAVVTMVALGLDLLFMKGLDVPHSLLNGLRNSGLTSFFEEPNLLLQSLPVLPRRTYQIPGYSSRTAAVAFACHILNNMLYLLLKVLVIQTQVCPARRVHSFLSG